MLKKKLIPIAASLLLVGVVPMSTNASVLKKNVTVDYHDIKVKYNNSQVYTDIEPFIINGTTYIPLRMMANVFNKNVSWDGTTYTINVTDKDDPRIATLQAQLNAKDAEIQRLNNRISDLQDELDNADSSDDIDNVISDLEDQLNDDYGDYKGASLDISLDGDEDDIDVEIQIDQSDYDDLSQSQLEKLVTDICEDIWNESDLEDADISGTFIDENDDDIVDFSGDAGDGTIELDGDEI